MPIAGTDDRPFLTDYVAKETPDAMKVIIPDVLQRCNPCTDCIALHGSMAPLSPSSARTFAPAS